MIANVDEDTKQLGTLYMADGSVNCYNYFEKQFGLIW